MSETLKKPFTLFEDEECSIYLNSCPVTPGTLIIESKRSKCGIFQLPLSQYKHLLFRAREFGQLLEARLSVHRCALVTDPCSERPRLKIIPLHSIPSAEWKPMLHAKLRFDKFFPGFCDSKNAPRMPDEELAKMQKILRSPLLTPVQTESFKFFGAAEDSNLFSRIVRGEEPQWRIWEDDAHVAFLTPFPNTPGFTVVVPRSHLSSNIFSLALEDYEKFIEAAYKVSGQIVSALSITTVCMIFEGFEIDYAHLKLIPVLENANESSEKSKILPLDTVFFDEYNGYVTTLDGPECPHEDLLKIYNKIQ